LMKWLGLQIAGLVLARTKFRMPEARATLLLKIYTPKRWL
jgi:hypothetical protein